MVECDPVVMELIYVHFKDHDAAPVFVVVSSKIFRCRIGKIIVGPETVDREHQLFLRSIAGKIRNVCGQRIDVIFRDDMLKIREPYPAAVLRMLHFPCYFFLRMFVSPKDEPYRVAAYVQVAVFRSRGCLSPVCGTVLHTKKADHRSCHVDRKKILSVRCRPVPGKVRNVKGKAVIAVPAKEDRRIVPVPAVSPAAHFRNVDPVSVKGRVYRRIKELLVKAPVRDSDRCGPGRVIEPADTAVIVIGHFDHRPGPVHCKAVRPPVFRMVARHVGDPYRK